LDLATQKGNGGLVPGYTGLAKRGAYETEEEGGRGGRVEKWKRRIRAEFRIVYETKKLYQEDEERRLLGCYAVWLLEPTFRRNSASIIRVTRIGELETKP
jgi:hypothetical protein